ncbi:uncharacterized protein LOC110027370 [Phalaenopsis equestris]|uniref:uncharacterized protein LOC110027370 n=1 Tax=Phalaenopsis equestris TaxID=78828 RepID=UPI0009E40EF2|nr:uncharacterized protein LOC110027370 [Phalaenopsis equestris]
MAGGRDGSKKVQSRGLARGAASAATFTTTADGEELTVSELISRLDEEGRRRLESMNQKLRDLENQMEALETEMNKANECC